MFTKRPGIVAQRVRNRGFVSGKREGGDSFLGRGKCAYCMGILVVEILHEGYEMMVFLGGGGEREKQKNLSLSDPLWSSSLFFNICEVQQRSSTSAKQRPRTLHSSDHALTPTFSPNLLPCPKNLNPPLRTRNETPYLIRPSRRVTSDSEAG